LPTSLLLQGLGYRLKAKMRRLRAILRRLRGWRLLRLSDGAGETPIWLPRYSPLASIEQLAPYSLS